MPDTSPKRRRFQFRLRTLLVAVGIVSLLLGWWANEKRWEAQETEAKAEIRRAGGKVIPAEISFVYFSVEGVWLSGTPVADNNLKHVGRLRCPKWIDLSKTKITDAGLIHLKGLSGLRHLDLTDTHVTTEGVKKLQESLPNCKIEY